MLVITRSGTTGSLLLFMLGNGGGFSANLAGGDTTIYCIFIFVWLLLSVTRRRRLLDYIVVELHGCTIGLVCTSAERS